MVTGGQDFGRNPRLTDPGLPQSKDSDPKEVRCCGQSWDQCSQLELVLESWKGINTLFGYFISFTYTAQWKSPPLSLQVQSSSKVHIGKKGEQASSDSSEKSPQSSVPSHTVTRSVQAPVVQKIFNVEDCTNKIAFTIVTCEVILTTAIRGRAREGAVRKAEVVQSKQVTNSIGLSFNEQGEEI